MHYQGQSSKIRVILRVEGVLQCVGLLLWRPCVRLLVMFMRCYAVVREKSGGVHLAWGLGMTRFIVEIDAQVSACSEKLLLSS